MGYRLVGLAMATTLGMNAGMLISVEELAGRLNDKNLVVLHVGSQKDYDAGHIPGARLVTLGDISVTGEGGLRMQLPAVEQLKTALEKLGICDGTQVVLYPAGESIQSATRVWFTFDYLGLGKQASLLDGGLIAWRAAGKQVSTEAPQIVTGSLTGLRPNPSLVVDAAWIRERLNDPSIQLIDARTPEFFSGADPGQMPRAGRIPGAKNVPFVSLVDAQRKLIPAGDLKAKVGTNGRTVVSYCHIGMQATVVYFVARLVDQDVKLYDGSFQDWSQRSELPVQTGQ
jgi:thiosulfate/3-mercaptopyruvate sulfurtransferase